MVLMRSGVGHAICDDPKAKQLLTKEDLTKKLQQDPFVAHDVVRPEILDVSHSKTCAELRFLLAEESV